MPEMFAALQHVTTPFAFIAFLAAVVGTIPYVIVKNETVMNNLSSRLSEDKLFDLLTYLPAITFVFFVFISVVMVVPPETPGFYGLLGLTLIFGIFIFAMASYTVKNKKGKSQSPPELKLIGNVYWKDNDEGVSGVKLRVEGVRGEWLAAEDGHFELSIRDSAYTRKKHAIRVFSPHSQNLLTAVKTSKTSGIVIKVPRPNPADAPPHNSQPEPQPAPVAPLPEAEGYNTKKIQKLLEGFDVQTLRSFCLTTPEFEDVYHKLATETGKDVLIEKIIAHANNTFAFDTLLEWAKGKNLNRYKVYFPYGKGA